MSAGEMKEYLNLKGFEYREQGDECVVKVCPFCSSDKWKFSCNIELGIYKCWHGDCNAAGNLYQLKEHLGDLKPASAVSEVWGDVSYEVVSHEEVDLYHKQLKENSKGLQYLYGRMIGNEAIDQFLLGLAYKDQGHFLTFPYFKDGVCVNIKFRSLPPLPKDFHIKAHHERPLYGLDFLDPAAEEVILIEGESDLISAWCLGYRNILALPQGAKNFESGHWDTLVKFKKIYILLDYDGPGREAVQKVASRLGTERCYNVKIPNGMDVNELLVKFGYEEGKKRLDACIIDAELIGKGEVAGVDAALVELEDIISNSGGTQAGFISPWPSLNKVVGCLGLGEVMLLQAIPKTGKSTFAQQWLAWLAQQCNVPTMMYCLEMPLHRLAQSLVAYDNARDRDELEKLHVQMTRTRFRGVPYFYGTIPKELTFEHVKEVITYSVRRYGIQVVCFDNLQFLCRGHDVFQQQADVSRNFKQLAGTLNIAILLVVQPRKMDPRFSPGLYDPSGSGSIIADADGMISMWRRPRFETGQMITDEEMVSEERESLEPEVLVSVPASRYKPGGRALLWIDGPTATFSEIEENSENQSGLHSTHQTL